MEQDPTRARIAELERELAEAGRQSGAVFVLQQVLSTMTAALEIDDLLAIIIRGIGEALDFPRVVLFTVGALGEVTPRLQRLADGSVINGDAIAFKATDSLLDIAHGKQELLIADVAAVESPLPDASGTFCIVPLTARDTVRGLFYVDRPASKDTDEFELGMLLIFASQAAIAIEGARLLDETQRLAVTDVLTGIPNRRGFEAAIERDLLQAKRYDEQRGFLIFDLDGFKQINDTSGHAAGDRYLKNFAATLTRSTRAVDIVARYAGDEFIAVLHKTDRDLTRKGAARILHELNTAGFRCSIGIALFPENGSDWQSLFAAADRALYQAKANGRNQYVLCE